MVVITTGYKSVVNFKYESRVDFSRRWLLSNPTVGCIGRPQLPLRMIKYATHLSIG